METIEIIQSICHDNPQIAFLLFYPLSKQQLLQSRIQIGEKEKLQYIQALSIREKYHLPFWDSIMLTMFNNHNFSSSIMNAAMLHNKLQSPIKIEVNTKLKEKLDRLRIQSFGWNSLIELKNGKTQHIPMFDFHIPVSPTNTNVVRNVLEQLGLTTGYILNSGESYHYIHNKPIDYNDFKIILIQSLFFSPIIDRLWVAHQLLNESAMLRIGMKHGKYPTTIL